MSVVQRSVDQRRHSAWVAPEVPSVAAGPLKGLAFFILALPLFPSLAVVIAALVGDLAGCDRAAGACRIGAVDLGNLSLTAAEAAWAMPVFIALPMLFATVLIHRSTEDFGVRLVWGAMLPGLTLLAVLAAPVGAAWFADHDACRITAAGVGTCRIYGVEWGEAYATSAVVPWLLIPAIPTAVIYGLVYLGYVRVSTWATRRPPVAGIATAHGRGGMPEPAGRDGAGSPFSRGAASTPGSFRSGRA